VGDIVAVRWIDASYERGELSAEEMDPLAELETVGFLVREDKDSMSVASERGIDDKHYRHISHIPRSCIVTVRSLGKWNTSD
jgi:hypothetical protein